MDFGKVVREEAETLRQAGRMFSLSPRLPCSWQAKEGFAGCYHHEDRTHLGLEKGTSDGRIRSVASGRVHSQERFGGLHHR